MFDQNQLHAVEEGTPAGSNPPPRQPLTQQRTAPVMPAQPTPAAGTSNAAPAANVSMPPVATPSLSVENADIYYMPENFQKNNQVAGKTTTIRGIWVLLTIIFLLILLGAGVYAFWLQPEFIDKILGRQTTNNQPAPVAQTPSESTPLQPSASTRPTGSPKEAYLVFRSELSLADTVESYLAAYAKYATSQRYAALTEEKNRLEATAGTPAQLLAALRHDPLPTLDGTEDISEEVSDQRAILTVTKTNKRQIGTIVFLPEKGQWKLSEEVWQNSSEPEQPTPANPQAALDDDADGLTNEEEMLLGTDPKAVDSDKDTYNDLEEMNNGYNPAGAGKLSDNPKLATYLNTTFNLSLLYPAAWERTVASTDDSVILTAPDRQFIQVLIQPNTDREDIITWYKKIFSVETVPTAQLIANNAWDGVRRPDGQTVYLTNKDKSYIFIVTYNLGSTSILNYKNIFELILRSLTITP